MDVSLIIFIIVVAFFAYRGFRHGFVKSLSRISGLVAGYLAAILFATPVSGLIEQQFPLAGMAAFIIASLVLFVGAGIAVSVVFRLINKLIAEKETSSPLSCVGGAAIGLVMGLVVAIVVVWSFAFVRDMDAQDNAPGLRNTDSNTIEKLAGRVMGTALESVMSRADAQPEVINLSSAMIQSPAEIAKRVQRLSASADLQTLLQDPQNQAVLDSGDIIALQELPAFQQLVNNPDMLALIKSAGMVDQSATGNNSSSKNAEVVLATQMSDIWLRMEQVKNDQRVQEILNDPEFQQKIESGNPVTLLTNTRLLELAGIVFSDTGKQDQSEPDQSALEGLQSGVTESLRKEVPKQELSKQASPEKETVIHQWVDENGRIHFSDEKHKP
jgi:uncharacterized membrane protein required for colicin V production